MSRFDPEKHEKEGENRIQSGGERLTFACYVNGRPPRMPAGDSEGAAWWDGCDRL